MIERQEFSPTAEARAEVVSRLESIEMSPEDMFEVAKEIFKGSEILGTNLTVKIGEKKTNPDRFSVDFLAFNEGSSGDGPNHTGHAKIFIPSEGTRPMLTIEGSKGYLNTLFSQFLKVQKKGYQAGGLAEGESISTKAGRLSDAEKDSLDTAVQSMIWEVVERLAAEKAGVDGYKSDLSDARSRQINEYIGSVDDPGAGRLVLEMACANICR